MRPVNIIQGKGFISMIESFSSTYTIPSRTTIMNIIKQLYYSESTLLKNMLSKCTVVSLTTDGWTSINCTHFITTTVTFYDGKKIISKVLQTRSYMVYYIYISNI